MDTETAKRTVKLYESCAFDELMGDTLRPGGLDLTARLADSAGIAKGMTVLDTACGKGTTALFLANKYQCRVVGMDLSEQMISIAEKKAQTQGFSRMVHFCLGDAEELPFRAESFDVVISECAFSLMPDKEKAAGNIRRVLRKGGRLAMTDMVLRGTVDDTLRGKVGFACCMAGALSAEAYIGLFARSGFDHPHLENHADALRQVAFQMGLHFGSVDRFVSRLPTGPCERKAPMESLGTRDAYLQFVKQGRPGYALLVMTKKNADTGIEERFR